MPRHKKRQVVLGFSHDHFQKSYQLYEQQLNSSQSFVEPFCKEIINLSFQSSLATNFFQGKFLNSYFFSFTLPFRIKNLGCTLFITNDGKPLHFFCHQISYCNSENRFMQNIFYKTVFMGTIQGCSKE